MDEEPEPDWSATEQLLIAIHAELDAVEELASVAGAEQNFAKMARHLARALALAEAGEILKGSA